MNLQGIGDLAQSFQLRRDNARLQDTLRTLAGELSSGRRQDLGRALSGDFGTLAGIERDLRAIDAYRASTSEARLLIEAAQSTLGFLAEKVASVTPALLLVDPDYDPTIVNSAARSAARAFEDVAGALNTRVGDRSVFGGVRTDGRAVADASAMLDELEALAASQTTAAGVKAVVEAWFAPGGGFETSGYTGAPQSIVAIPVSRNEAVSLDVRADDAGVRGILAGLAVGALVDRGALASVPEERAALARSAGERLLSADFGLTQTRARVGDAEGRIADAEARNASEAQAMELARAELLSADPFETASRMREVEVQLETLYTVTARMARLNLTAFL